MDEQFIPFPAERQNQIETRKKNAPNAPVVNPHHPNNRIAAQGMTLAAPGTPAPTPRTVRPVMPQPMAAPMPDQDAPVPVQLTPNSEAEAVSFAVPSNFHYYPFKELYIKPFKGRNFAKLHMAREEESMLHVVEAVSSVISTPSVPHGLGFYLTLPDFYACLYWLRLHSFLKHGFIHQTMCRNQEHHDWVLHGREIEPGKPKVKVEADTLKYAENITKTSLKTRQLEKLPNPEDYPLEYPGIRLVPALMKDILEILMNDQLDRFSARIASSIQFVDHEGTLAERIAIVDDLSADDIATVMAYEKVAGDYGVEETISWTCKTCGQKHLDQIQLEAHSFFPSAA